MACDQPVERVDDPREAQPTEHLGERAGQPELGQEDDTTSAVARHRRPVAQHDPPAFSALLRRDGRENGCGLVVAEREERDPLTPVERRDDTRREATEPSPARVQQHGAPERSGWHLVCHARDYARSGRAEAATLARWVSLRTMATD